MCRPLITPGKALTSVVCTDLTAFGLYLRPRSTFSHTDLLLGYTEMYNSMVI